MLCIDETNSELFLLSVNDLNGGGKTELNEYTTYMRTRGGGGGLGQSPSPQKFRKSENENERPWARMIYHEPIVRYAYEISVHSTLKKSFDFEIRNINFPAILSLVRSFMLKIKKIAEKLGLSVYYVLI